MSKAVYEIELTLGDITVTVLTTDVQRITTNEWDDIEAKPVGYLVEENDD